MEKICRGPIRRSRDHTKWHYCLKDTTEKASLRIGYDAIKKQFPTEQVHERVQHRGVSLEYLGSCSRLNSWTERDLRTERNLFIVRKQRLIAIFADDWRGTNRYSKQA